MDEKHLKLIADPGKLKKNKIINNKLHIFIHNTFSNLQLSEKNHIYNIVSNELEIINSLNNIISLVIKANR